MVREINFFSSCLADATQPMDIQAVDSGFSSSSPADRQSPSPTGRFDMSIAVDDDVKQLPSLLPTASTLPQTTQSGSASSPTHVVVKTEAQCTENDLYTSTHNTSSVLTTHSTGLNTCFVTGVSTTTASYNESRPVTTVNADYGKVNPHSMGDEFSSLDLKPEKPQFSESYDKIVEVEEEKGVKPTENLEMVARGEQTNQQQKEIVDDCALDLSASSTSFPRRYETDDNSGARSESEHIHSLLPLNDIASSAAAQRALNFQIAVDSSDKATTDPSATQTMTSINNLIGALSAKITGSGAAGETGHLNPPAQVGEPKPEQEQDAAHLIKHNKVAEPPNCGCVNRPCE